MTQHLRQSCRRTAAEGQKDRRVTCDFSAQLLQSLCIATAVLLRNCCRPSASYHFCFLATWSKSLSATVLPEDCLGPYGAFTQRKLPYATGRHTHYNSASVEHPNVSVMPVHCCGLASVPFCFHSSRIKLHSQEGYGISQSPIIAASLASKPGAQNLLLLRFFRKFIWVRTERNLNSGAKIELLQIFR